MSYLRASKLALLAPFLIASAVGAPLPLKVVGPRLLNAKNQPVRLRGVNAAGLEWSVDGGGHMPETLRTAFDRWHANIVRLPLSQDRWFGKAPEQRDGGVAYRRLVAQLVHMTSSRGCYIILDLHWSDMNQWGMNIGQHVLPDLNSIVFWKSCAAVYRNNSAVLFDLYNEPHNVTWDQWLKGGMVDEKDWRGTVLGHYRAVGMQAMLNAVRGTGAKNVAIAGGLDWAYDLSGILAGRELADPHGAGVIYANHNYPKFDAIPQWEAMMANANKKLALIVSEFGCEIGPGAEGDFTRRDGAWVQDVLDAARRHGWSYTAWDLHPSAGPRLISDWDYTPTVFGALVKADLAKRP